MNFYILLVGGIVGMCVCVCVFIRSFLKIKRIDIRRFYFRIGFFFEVLVIFKILVFWFKFRDFGYFD